MKEDKEEEEEEEEFNSTRVAAREGSTRQARSRMEALNCCEVTSRQTQLFNFQHKHIHIHGSPDKLISQKYIHKKYACLELF